MHLTVMRLCLHTFSGDLWLTSAFCLLSNTVVLHEHVCLMWYYFFSVHVGWVKSTHGSAEEVGVKDCKPDTFCCSGRWSWAQSILKCNRKLWKLSLERNGSILFSNDQTVIASVANELAFFLYTRVEEASGLDRRWRSLSLTGSPYIKV